AREWAKWEKAHPQSPLLPSARLDQAWNALRRGDTAAALKTLDALAKAQPELEKNPRFALAHATALERSGKPDQALAVLGPKPQGAAANWVRALCLRRQGALLPAAAAFQEVAERWPDSPLRDPALLAKANTFLAARDPKSAVEEFGRVAERARDPRVQAEA